MLEFTQPYPITARIALAAGWNLVSLPSQTSVPYSAASIVSQIDQEGGNVMAVAIYQSGGYSVFVPGFKSDFPVTPKEGIFVLAKTASVWSVT